MIIQEFIIYNKDIRLNIDKKLFFKIKIKYYKQKVFKK